MKPTYFDLTVRDLGQARAFFESVFGWRFEKFPMPYEYFRIQAGPEGEPGIDGGIGEVKNTPTAEGKPMTQVTVPVPDLDAAISKVLGSGGSVVEAKMRIPGIGWYATCAEPGGLLFGMIQADPTNKVTIPLPIDDFSEEQRELWKCVTDLWALSKGRDEGSIRSTLHPDYVGWDMTAQFPHARDAAVLSVSGDSPELREYDLRPLSVQVYEGKVGVAHYSYSATVVAKNASPIRVTGKWSEVYLKQRGTWIMISVSGRPDVSMGLDHLIGCETDHRPTI